MSEKNMYLMCRTCLNYSCSSSHIFKELLGGVYLYEVLIDVCQLEVNVDDGLPEQVCFDCYKKLSEFQSFKMQSHEGNAALHRMKYDGEKVHQNDRGGLNSSTKPESKHKPAYRFYQPILPSPGKRSFKICRNAENKLSKGDRLISPLEPPTPSILPSFYLLTGSNTLSVTSSDPSSGSITTQFSATKPSSIPGTAVPTPDYLKNSGPKAPASGTLVPQTCTPMVLQYLNPNPLTVGSPAALPITLALLPQAAATVVPEACKPKELLIADSYEGKPVAESTKEDVAGCVPEDSVTSDDEAAIGENFVPIQTEIYIDPGEVESNESAPIGRDPLEVDIKHEIEDPLDVDEDEDDVGQEVDLQVPISPVDMAEKIRMIMQEGVDEENREEQRYRMDIQKIDKGKESFGDENLVLNAEEIGDNDIQSLQGEKGDLKTVSVGSFSDSRDAWNDGVEENEDVVDRLSEMGDLNACSKTSRVRFSEMGDFNACSKNRGDRFSGIGDFNACSKTSGDNLSNVGEYDPSVDIDIKSEPPKDDESGESCRVDEELMVERFEGENSGNCDVLICDDCGKEFSNKQDLLDHAVVHYGLSDIGCILGDDETAGAENSAASDSDRKRGSKVRKNNRKKKGEWICKWCNKQFAYSSILKYHEFVHTRDKPFACKYCSKKFSLRSNLNKHEFNHTGVKPYVCQVCDKRFSNNGGLKNHSRIHLTEKKFECELCNKKFSHVCNLKRHQKLHENRILFRCNFCDKEFSSKQYLKEHVRIHLGEERFTCRYCERICISACHLKKHERLHTDDWPLRCGTCHKGFSSKTHLKLHEIVHSGEKPFKCDKCSMAFAYKTSLQFHAILHTGEKPFQCGWCDRTFSHKSYKRKHERLHTRENPS